MTEDETKKKQEYLRTEIIDGNYDVEEFQEYISSLRGFFL